MRHISGRAWLLSMLSSNAPCTLRTKWSLNDLGFTYHVGIIIGGGIWPQFYGSFGTLVRGLGLIVGRFKDGPPENYMAVSRNWGVLV